MPTIKCRFCKDNLEYPTGTAAVKCLNCLSTQSVPSSLSDENEEIFSQALELRNNREFDKAYKIYRDLNKKYPKDIDIFWELILCRFGLIYEKKAGKKDYFPVINRLSDTMIFDDEDYKKIMDNSELVHKQIFRRDAIAIYEIQKKCLKRQKVSLLMMSTFVITQQPPIPLLQQIWEIC
ncbi:MAG: hypothetical protein K6E72_05090 [Saccharofermentans sp.]|nr:hypothetical protein [Saccharofermentans sp.]